MPTTETEARPVTLAAQLQQVARKTTNRTVADLLMDAANELVNAWEAMKAIDSALDASTERTRGYIDRIRIAIAAPEDANTEQVLSEAAQWCEALSGLQEATA